jgi:hypothetical protein
MKGIAAAVAAAAAVSWQLLFVGRWGVEQLLQVAVELCCAARVALGG